MPPHLLKQFVFSDLVPANEVMPKALEWAEKIVECSPDAVWVTKEQINLYKDGTPARHCTCKDSFVDEPGNPVVYSGKGVNEVVLDSMDTERAQVTYDGENMKEGLRAFVEKRKPMWTDPPRLSKAKL
jgi:1,4-dihydroxy-2-naphthoyl-CoA synthase